MGIRISLKGIKSLKPAIFALVLAFGFSISNMQLHANSVFGSEMQQGETYTGKVSDKFGNSLPGVTVLIKGTTNGTVTGIEGDFTLNANVGDVMVFSFIGYRAQELTLTGNRNINIELAEDIVGLGEVVVVGYGVMQKKDLTGATVSLGEGDLNQGAITNPLQQISGRAAGVSITQVGSEPGSNPSVRIRGITSLIGGNDPLVVIDGIQGNIDLLNQIPPTEIASIDILKDASATAIYGSRGAPGVILVTTKRNDKGRSTVEYSGSMSVDMLSNKLEMFTATEWREMSRLWDVPYSADHGSDTDWYNILIRNGSTNNHTISMGGSAKDFNYRASVTAILHDGIVINSNNNNYIARIQATQKTLNDKLTFSVNLNSSIRKNVGSPGSVGRAAFRSNLISNAYVSKPTDPVLFHDGSYYYDENVFQYINPYAVAQEVINENETHNLFGSFRADLEIFKDISLGWFGSWRKVDINRGYYAPSKSTLSEAIDHNGIANVATNLQDEKLMDISLSFDKTFGKNQLKGVFVYEWQSQLYQGHFAQARGFINDITTYNALQLGTISNVLPGDISSYKNDRKLVSFLGRLNYSFDDKYLLTLSMRRDGSSVFGSNHKWGTFPSASAAWRITEEGFMKDITAISNLKLRAGYGITGNQQGLYPQRSLQLIGESGVTNFNEQLITNFAVNQNANDDLQWETRYQTNIGLDFGFLDGRINGSVDLFSATTRNLLFNYTVPQPPYPFGSIVANVGSLKNEGIELVLNYQIVNTKDLRITLGGNVSLLRNEVLELSGSLNGVPLMTDYVGMGYNAYLIEGQPIGVFNILQHEGRDEANSELVVDQNNDGIIDQGDRSLDRYFAGSALPTYSYGFTPEVKYKNIDLTMVWRGSGGNMIYNSIKSSFSYFENLGKSNLLRSAAELGLYTSKYGSDLWLEKGDYLRFDNLTIGYTFNTNKIENIQSLRISVTGNNLAVFTHYTGLDPEIRVDGGNGSGADAGIYPRVKSFSAGINIIF